MKKIIAIITLISYLFTASSIVHAHAMGFSHNHKTTTSNCHTNTPTTDHHMDCCELFTASTYSSVYIELQDHIKSLPYDVCFFSTAIKNIDRIYLSKYVFNHPPRQTIGKYLNFSDLVGIVVYIG